MIFCPTRLVKVGGYDISTAWQCRKAIPACAARLVQGVHRGYAQSLEFIHKSRMVLNVSCTLYPLARTFKKYIIIDYCSSYYCIPTYTKSAIVYILSILPRVLCFVQESI